MVKEEIAVEKILDIVADALSLDEDEVSKESHLINDLAAESIDFVDITFKLEKEFGFKVNPNDIFPTFLQFTDVFGDNGLLQDEFKSKLQSEYPHFSSSLIEKFESTKDESIFFLVNTIIVFIEYKLNN